MIPLIWMFGSIEFIENRIPYIMDNYCSLFEPCAYNRFEL